MKFRLSAAAVAAAAFSFASAQAATIEGETSGISDPDTLITFGEIVLTDNQAVTDEYESLGVTFSPNLYYQSSGVSPRPNFELPALSNFGEGDLRNPFSIQFVRDVNAASFTLTTGPGRTTTFNALRDGVIVATFSAATNPTDDTNIYGFFGLVFDEIQILVGQANSNNFVVIDNLAFSEVPLPAALPLFIAGLAGLGFAGRRRKVAA